MPKLTALPTPRFKVRKDSSTATFYVVHFEPDTLRWCAYENISSTRVPIAKRYDDHDAAQAVADNFTRRWPWKDFDRQLFEARSRGDHDWPSRPGEAAQVAEAAREHARNGRDPLD